MIYCFTATQIFQQECASNIFATCDKDDEVHVASVIQRMLSESPEPNVLQITTGGGRVSKFV